MKIARLFLLFLFFPVLIFTTSCSQEEGGETDIITNVIITPAPLPLSDEETLAAVEDEGVFVADFPVTLGTFETGADILQALLEETCLVSAFSTQILENPLFRVAAEETTADVVVVSMLDLGFLEGELATLETILKKAEKLGLEVCPPELAAQLRLQFVDQPDWSTGDRLGEFFVATEAITLGNDGIPRIFSIIRDDKFPHAGTGIGLWLIGNNTIDAADEERRGRLFNASDPEGHDLGGRFAFVIPPKEKMV